MYLGLLQEALAERGSPWTANVRRPAVDRRRWIAGVPEIDAAEALRAASSRLQPAHSSKLLPPEKFDWRSSEADILGPVKDQSTCCSCAAFAVCAVMETALRIRSDGGPDIDLSEADLFFCGGGIAEVGMSVDEALSRARLQGVGLESEFPYSPSADACIPIAPVARVTGVQHVVDARERRFAIAENGPVLGVMRVYEDLLDYSQGVYEHVAGSYEGLHAVAVVGYDDIQRCWIVRNSWGSEAGEAGYVRVRYGQCELDARPFYVLDVESLR
jgi:C1A family cysteine protease